MEPFAPGSMVDRLLGCVVGGAIGDALGGVHENRVGPVTPGPTDAWFSSDDTQLTLATCEAIGAGGTVAPEDVAARMLAWFRRGGLTGLGASTLKALRDLDAGAHWSLAGRSGDRAAGNGAAMRAAPLAFCLDPDDASARATVRDVSWITHRSDEAYAGALAVVRAVRLAAGPAWSSTPNLAATVADGLPDTIVRDALRRAAALPANLPIARLADELA